MTGKGTGNPGGVIGKIRSRRSKEKKTIKEECEKPGKVKGFIKE